MRELRERSRQLDFVLLEQEFFRIDDQAQAIVKLDGAVHDNGATRATGPLPCTGVVTRDSNNALGHDRAWKAGDLNQ